MTSRYFNCALAAQAHVCKNNIYPNIDDQFDRALNGQLVANIPVDNDAIALNKAHLERLKTEDRTNPLVVDLSWWWQVYRLHYSWPKP